MKTCLICDDHAMLRETLVVSVELGWPGVEVTQAGDFPSAWAAAAARPDFIMCDLDMPGASPLDGVRGVMTAAPQSPLLVVTGSQDEALLLQLFDAGIAGFLPKTSHGSIIDAAIRLILAGGHYVPRHIIEMAAARAGNHPAPSGSVDPGSLTARQLEVLGALAQGKSNKEIARTFDLSPATVRAHASAVYLALGVANRTEAVAKALSLGIVVAQGS